MAGCGDGELVGQNFGVWGVGLTRQHNSVDIIIKISIRDARISSCKMMTIISRSTYV